MPADHRTVVCGVSEIADLAGDDQRQGPAEGTRDAEQRGGLEAAQARADDDQHAEHSGGDRGPSARADDFAQQRDGQDGDQHRRQEADGCRLRHGHLPHAVDEQDG